MDVNEYIDHIKQAKPSQIQTGFFHIKCQSNPEHTLYILYRENHCKHCGITTNQKLGIMLKQSHHLTIFEAEMLFAIFCLKKKPADYSSYHKCIAGKRFIENIKEVRK